MPEPKAMLDYSDLASGVQFLKRTRSELRELHRARVYADRLQVFDVNGDYFELRGVGYRDEAIAELLRMVNAAFDPDTIHRPPPGEYREVDTGRRYPWAHDRAM